MRENLAPSEVERMLPAEPGLRAHCRRVAALAEQVGAHLRLPPTEVGLLSQCALLHHQPVLPQDGNLGRLISDLAGAAMSSGAAEAGANRPEKEEALGRIVEVCNLFDEQMEWLPWEHKPVREVVRGLSELADSGLADRAAVGALASLTARYGEVAKPFPDLMPPAANAAQRAFQRLGGRREFDIRELEDIASADPMLATSLVRSANSPLFAPLAPIATLRAAITYLGTTQSSRILLALVLRPLLRVAGLEEIWRHSVEVSVWCERMARTMPGVDPREALMAGLVHDIGRAAMQCVPGAVRSTLTEMVGAGCPPAYAETVLTGVDHGEAGGEILRAWHFPEPLVEGIQWHHQPERTESRLASLLYVAEFWHCAEEDLPSESRLRGALSRVGLTMQQLTVLGGDKDVSDALYTLLAA